MSSRKKTRTAVLDQDQIDREVIAQADDKSAWEAPIRIMRHKPASLVSLRNVDRESLALSTNPQFLGIIEKARKEIRAGKTISLESVEKKFELDVPKKRRKRTVGVRSRHPFPRGGAL